MALLELHQKSSFLLDASMHRVQPHLVSYEYERLTRYSLHYGTDYRCLPQRILLRSFVDHCNPQPKKHELLGIYQLRDQLRIPLSLDFVIAHLHQMHLPMHPVQLQQSLYVIRLCYTKS